MSGKFSWLLKLRGMHYLATRFGPKWLKSLAFDEKYRSGDWNFNGENSNELVEVVASRAHHGDVLIMGCGSASLLSQLDPASYNSILGVDLSAEAIRLAQQHTGNRIRFEVADMTMFECRQSYDVILFSESLYYVPSGDRKRLLVQLSQHLKPEGCLIVTIAQPVRYGAILAMIRENFEVLEDRNFRSSERRLQVFRGAGKLQMVSAGV